MSKQRVKVLQLISGINTGGAEMAMFRISADLLSQGYDIRVVCLKNHAQLQPRFDALGIQVSYLFQPWLWPATLFRLRKFRPDVLQCWMPHANVIGILFAKLVGARILVWNVRQTLNRYEKISRLTRFFIELGATLSHAPRAIIYNSEQGRIDHERRGYLSKRGLVIENGFNIPTLDNKSRADARARFKMEPSSIFCIFVGRDHPDKDVETFLKAAIEQSRRDRHFRFALAGQGFEAESSPRWAFIPHELRPHFIFLGSINQVQLEELYRAADIFISSSISEGFSNVLAEAMSFGIVPIASDVGDSKKICAGIGWVVLPRDVPAILRAFDQHKSLNSDYKETLRRRAHTHIKESYSSEKCLNRYVHLYQELIR